MHLEGVAARLGRVALSAGEMAAFGARQSRLRPAGEQSHRHGRCVLPLNRRRAMRGMSLMGPGPPHCARRSRSFYISMPGFWLLG